MTPGHRLQAAHGALRGRAGTWGWCWVPLRERVGPGPSSTVPRPLPLVGLPEPFLGSPGQVWDGDAEHSSQSSRLRRILPFLRCDSVIPVFAPRFMAARFHVCQPLSGEVSFAPDPALPLFPPKPSSTEPQALVSVCKGLDPLCGWSLWPGVSCV